MRYSRTLFFIAGLLFGASALRAQPDALFMGSQQQPIRVTALVFVQEYETVFIRENGISATGTISEVSIPLSVSVPLGRGLGASLLATQASVSGDVEALSGLGDVQIGLSYVRPLGAGGLVLNLGLNLPVGASDFSSEEFHTALLLSQHVYDFRVPGFGQGFNVAPGLTLALPLSDNFVVGVGAAYQYRGTFQPSQITPDDLDPGDEFLFTGGFDVRLGRLSAFSTDLTYALYGTDTWGDVEISAGERLTATAQLRLYLGAQEVLLLVRYRNRTENSLPDVAFVPLNPPVPRQALLHLAPRFSFGAGIFLGLPLQVRYFEESTFFGEQLLFDVGLAPEIVLSSRVSLLGQFVYTLGVTDVIERDLIIVDDFSGFKAGGGLQFEF